MVHESLAQAPEEIRVCISEMVAKARLENWTAGHVARQLWFTVKRGIIDVARYLEQYALKPILCQAKHMAVRFEFKFSSQVHVVYAQPVELAEI